MPEPTTILAQSVQDARDWFWGLPWYVWLLLLVMAAGVEAYAAEKALVKLTCAWAKRTKMKVDDVIVGSLHPSLGVAFFVLGVWAGLRLLPLRYDASVRTIVDNAGITILVVAVAVAAARLARGLLALPARREDRWLSASLVGNRIMSVAIYVIAFLMILNQYGIAITPILTTLGIATLAVGLALQDTLANLFAGLWLQTQRSMRPGHFVKIEDVQLEGFVKEIGWRTTKIQTLPGNMLVVPNQALAHSTVTDFSLPEPKMGTSITIVTGYETDPDRVVPMLLQEAVAASGETNIVLAHPSPAARLNRPVENGWEFWLGFWTPNYYNQWDAQGFVTNRIRRRFLQERIRMPLPVREQVAVPLNRPDIRESVVAARMTDGADTHEERGRPVKRSDSGDESGRRPERP